MNNTTKNLKIQGDILVFNVDFAVFMLKDGKIWLRYEDVDFFLTEAQKTFLLSDGVGLCRNMPDESINGVYIQFDGFIRCASTEAKPLLRAIRKILGMVAQEGGK